MSQKLEAHNLDAEALAILKKNDRGGFTIPTARLYPFQWNWDSAFIAIGLATYDRETEPGASWNSSLKVRPVTA